MEELQKAVQAMVPQQQVNIPPKTNRPHSASSTALSTLVLTTPASRSTANLQNSSPSPSSSDTDTVAAKPRIIRKKSGETVKSSLKLSSLVRHQSMPTTSKMVHFDDNLERVRHFLHSEKPLAVSASSSPTEERPKFHWGTDSDSESESDEEEEDPRLGFQRYLDRTEWHISLPNFKPAEHSDRMVYVESIFLSSDKNTLLGHIAVKNIAFEKHVSIRYSIDSWKTVTGLDAEYNDDVRRKRRHQGYDRFTFAINMGDFPQHAITTKSIFFCVRYVTAGQEFWDNNDGANYQVDFTRVTKVKSGVVQRPQSARLPARHHRRTKSSEPSFLFGQGNIRDQEPDHEHDDELFGALRPKFRAPLKKKDQFSSRYDFGSSFKSPDFGSKKKENKEKDPLALNAKSYQELIDSYCFFGGKPSPQKSTSPVGSPPGSTASVAKEAPPSPTRPKPSGLTVNTHFSQKPASPYPEWATRPGVSV